MIATMNQLDARSMRSVFDGLVDGVLIETDEQILYVNAAYAAMLGYRRADDLMQQRVVRVVADEDVPRLLEFGRRRRRRLEAPANYDFAARRSDGSTVRLQASVSTTSFFGRVLITSIVRPFYETESSEDAAVDPYAKPGPHQRLSARELDVMKRILNGQRLKEIALAFDVSVKTISTHRVRLLRKLGLPDDRSLFQYALRHRFIDWS
ncbi:MAG TPA: LuxR C-terminal-related transcriptional regulator [Thermoanaerobaculia bacterium]